MDAPSVSEEQIQRTVEDIREAVETVSEHPDEPGAKQKLEEAIDAARNALDVLDRRVQQTHALQDLDRFIEVSDRVLLAVPQGHASTASLLSDLSVALRRRFLVMGREGNPQDMDRAVALAEDAVAAVLPGTGTRRFVLGNLNKLLQERYEQTRDVKHIKRAVEAAEEATQGMSKNFSHAADLLNRLAMSLGKLFEHTHELGVAERAVAAAASAAETARAKGEDREAALAFNTLARVLGRRFEQTGDPDDIDRAINTLTDSVPRIPDPEGNEDRLIGLSYLANLLGTRFERQGVVTDLDDSIQYSQMAVDLMPDEDPGRLPQLFNLALRLAERAEYTKGIKDLDGAIAHGRRVLVLAPKNHPERAIWLCGVSRFFATRFTMGAKSSDDIRQAIDLSRQAVAVDPKDILVRGVVANAFSNVLKVKYEQDHRDVDWDDSTDLAYLNEAIDVLSSVVEGGFPESHPDRATLEFGLGDLLRTRYRQGSNTGDTGDLDRSKESFRQAWINRNAPTTVRIHAAIRVAEIAESLAEDCAPDAVDKDCPDAAVGSLRLRHWKEASTYIEHAVNLLHALSPRHMQNANKQHMLARFAGIGASAAAAALNAQRGAQDALQQLELGRSIISGLLLDLRTDLSVLREKHPDLEAQFSRLRDMLDSGGRVVRSTASWESQSHLRRRAEKEFEALLTKIRSEEGFDRFLLPFTAEQMMEAADPSPAVVVNVSSARCDAFIVRKDGIEVLELPLLRLKDVQARRKWLQGKPDMLPSTLEWLWEVLVQPVLDNLGFGSPFPPGDSAWPHMWWIPVGPLSSLPLHAAGYHTRRSGETALDRVMSSYSSSLKSLISGRLGRTPCCDTSPIKALLVSMKSTPGYAPLPYAEREAAMLEELCPSLNATLIKPPERKADVLEQLGRCDMFHFAGHGVSDPSDPSQSALVLRDWEDDGMLTVDDLRDQKLQRKPPFLAYLSACSTAANEVLGLIDEGIHLGYACQLAGFRHVVGTLWTVSDPFCVELARRFYETISKEGRTDAAVHRGLHSALRALRDVQARTETRGPDCEGVDAAGGGAGGENGGGADVKDSGSGKPAASVSREEGEGNKNDGDRKGTVGGGPRPTMNSLWVPFVHFGV
ncbi:hypothetical protein GGTG_07473 [Gaeumannomyces tritici R3-111a-1]|uniref:CHAT domain-containing protein n=1 Tax=Gaeumannomyces tritici (strain R3-111a-1) TaxID=644352 RepID=J3P1S5_GAET3|nr:hypothetical protein GGTG_07473 [Gaeumannomyces tritici R3-111a-1]EJT73617.1 hypothetical protein GGTG_07473 [Gaeumannomyces tritici R3-111a-1]